MKEHAGVSKIFKTLKKNIRTLRAEAAGSLKKIEAAAKKASDNSVAKLAKQEKKNLDAKILEINKLTDGLQKDLLADVKQSTSILKTEIENLNRQKDAADSNSFLLEYKKNDLLLKTDELESANEEVSKKNKELLAHRQQIDRQAEELRVANEELQKKTESLLDQSDYLHEANETIASMVNKLEFQNQEILNKNEELILLNLEKNNLIGIVAHDLKSPLNQIKGLLSLVRMTGQVDEETSKYLGLMDQSVMRLNEMIAKILDVEAIESRKLNLKIERINLSEVLMAVADRYVNDAAKKNIIIHRSIAFDVFAQADKSYTEQVLENLISNAIKFSPFDRSVHINLIQKGTKPVCEVKDHGPGLSEEDKKKLFGKYQKLSARPTGNEISTGLGLSIVKKFVEAMEGEIWCESELGKGASFFVNLKGN
ncbi:MAG TPA: ATP-binding protein [Cyclobacteriaceae bacterium]|nr:ATP-binding protein [Cyclobacteriaceae bacterium]